MAAALALTLPLLSACAGSSAEQRRIALSAEKPEIPDADPRDRRPCPQSAVPEEVWQPDAPSQAVYSALAEAVYERQVCAGRHRNLVAHVDRIRREFGRKPPK